MVALMLEGTGENFGFFVNPEACVDPESWNNFVVSERPSMADLDRYIKSVTSMETAASLDTPSGLPISSPFSNPSQLSEAQQLPEEVDQLREAVRPVRYWDNPERTSLQRFRNAKEHADGLHQALESAIKRLEANGARSDYRAALESLTAFQEAVEAIPSVAAAPGLQQECTAGATKGREHPVGTFPLLREPAGKTTAQVSPKPFPATLQVASPSHGEVRVTGLARWFPAHTVHAKDCTTVIDGNDCTLTAKDHYHVRSVSVSFGKLAEAGSPENAALRRLIENPTDRGAAQFQKAMRQCIDAPAYGDTQTSLPVTSTHVTLASGAAIVHQGDGSSVDVTTHYVVEQSELSIAELCATDRAVVDALVNVIREPEPGAARDKFASAALRSAGHVDELALLDHSTELHGASTSVRGLFGVDAVKHASAVLVGTDNMLKTDMRLSRGRSTLGGGLADLDHIRNLAAEVRRPQTAVSRQQGAPEQAILPRITPRPSVRSPHRAATWVPRSAPHRPGR